jgi:hypothetical protein
MAVPVIPWYAVPRFIVNNEDVSTLYAPWTSFLGIYHVIGEKRRTSGAGDRAPGNSGLPKPSTQEPDELRSLLPRLTSSNSATDRNKIGPSEAVQISMASPKSASPKSADEVGRETLVTLEEVRVIAYRHSNSPDAGDPHVGTDPNATV